MSLHPWFSIIMCKFDAECLKLYNGLLGKHDLFLHTEFMCSGDIENDLITYLN